MQTAAVDDQNRFDLVRASFISDIIKEERKHYNVIVSSHALPAAMHNIGQSAVPWGQPLAVAAGLLMFTF